MDSKLLHEVAKTIKLSPIALEVYISLTKHGELSTTLISQLSEKPGKIVRKAVKELMDKHLIGTNDEKSEIFFARTLLEMQDQVEQHQRLIQDLKNFVYPNIVSSEENSFFEFEGWDEIRKLYNELIEEACKQKTHFLALENNLVNSRLGEDFVQKYINLRIHNKLKAFVMCPNNREDQRYKNTFEGKYTEIKLIDGLVVDQNINIVGDAVMWFSPSTLKGDFFKCASKANTLRSWFWKFWEHN